MSSVTFARESPSPAPDASIEVHLGKNCCVRHEREEGGFYRFLFLKGGGWKRAVFAMFVRRIL